MAAERNPPVAFPCLLRNHEGVQTAFSLPSQKLHHVSMPELSGNTFFATPQGWILVVVDSDSSPSKTYLLDPQAKSGVDLPALEDKLPKQCRCVLSGDDGSAPGCGVLVFDLQSPAMWFCRVGGRRWSRHVYDIGCYNLPEEYCTVPRRKNFFDAAAVGGRFFFFESDSNSELGTLDFTDGSAEPPEARLGAIAVPSLGDDLYGGRHQSCVVATSLLESGGDLYLAAIAFHDFCFDRPGKVGVYRMDFSASAWRRTDDVGDRAFLLGASNFGASCSASDRGLKRNCIYWVNRFSEEDNGVHVYDLKDGSLQSIQTFESAPPGQKPFWIVPIAS